MASNDRVAAIRERAARERDALRQRAEQAEARVREQKRIAREAEERLLEIDSKLARIFEEYDDRIDRLKRGLRDVARRYRDKREYLVVYESLYDEAIGTLMLLPMFKRAEQAHVMAKKVVEAYQQQERRIAELEAALEHAESTLARVLSLVSTMHVDACPGWGEPGCVACPIQEEAADYLTECPGCDGHGAYVEGDPSTVSVPTCRRCNGTGLVPREGARGGQKR